MAIPTLQVFIDASSEVFCKSNELDGWDFLSPRVRGHYFLERIQSVTELKALQHYSTFYFFIEEIMVLTIYPLLLLPRSSLNHVILFSTNIFCFFSAVRGRDSDNREEKGSRESQEEKLYWALLLEIQKTTREE